MNVDVFATLSLQPDGEDDLKKRQLMELAIINGTYRDTSKPPTTQAGGGQSSTSTRKSGGSRRPLATHASSVCSVYSFTFFPFIFPLGCLCLFFCIMVFFFLWLKEFFFSFHPLGDGHAWWIGSLIFCSSSCMIDRFYILSPCDGILSFLYISLYLWEERSNKTQNHIQFFV